MFVMWPFWDSKCFNGGLEYCKTVSLSFMKRKYLFKQNKWRWNIKHYRRNLRDRSNFLPTWMVLHLHKGPSMIENNRGELQIPPLWSSRGCIVIREKTDKRLGVRRIEILDGRTDSLGPRPITFFFVRYWLLTLVPLHASPSMVLHRMQIRTLKGVRITNAGRFHLSWQSSFIHVKGEV